MERPPKTLILKLLDRCQSASRWIGEGLPMNAPEMTAAPGRPHTGGAVAAGARTLA
jgi:hypothetical protein